MQYQVEIFCKKIMYTLTSYVKKPKGKKYSQGCIDGKIKGESFHIEGGQPKCTDILTPPQRLPVTSIP